MCHGREGAVSCVVGGAICHRREGAVVERIPRGETKHRRHLISGFSHPVDGCLGSKWISELNRQ